MAFEQPKRIYNKDGEIRKAGFELEFGNVPIEETTRIIQELFGGTINNAFKFKQKVENTSLGEFSVEIDTRFLTNKAYMKPLEKLNIDISKINMGDTNLEAELENLLEGVVKNWVPYEIGTPAIPITELHELVQVRVIAHMQDQIGIGHRKGVYIRRHTPCQIYLCMAQHPGIKQQKGPQVV